MINQSRMRKIGWAAVLLVCTALYLGLHLRVNAVKGQVRQAERRIVALQEQKVMLETEFETRSSQQQLATWNDVEFGYKAPTPGQFLEGERQLAQFGTPPSKGAPEPIRVARNSVGEDSGGSSTSGFPAMVSPMTGKAIAAELPRAHSIAAAARQELSARISGAAERVALDDVIEGHR